MQAEFYALLTAVCWSVGSLMEKTGVRLGNLTPVMGTTLRTFFSLLLLAMLSGPYWGEIKQAGTRPLLLVAAGGGILAGGLGIIFLYTGLKHGQLSSVMTIAFCLTPVLGVILGVLVLREKLNPVQLAGILLCIAGASMTVLFKDTGAPAQ
ncbi:MAG: EamA family transporter [Candidatus Fermentibacteraceae bacterium]|nr:EamA family transporter [Candidatus Fermentibacteraceae bacterium]MBN2607613.1 EamA family transporter [Candidatus Fermentibacteraceae bacterium]